MIRFDYLKKSGINLNNDIMNKNIVKNKMKFWTGNEIIDLKEGQIFVFGSNPVL